MARCEGRPNEACPGKVNNSSVKLSQSDLMFCKECENLRFLCTVVKSSTTADNSTSTLLAASSEFMSTPDQTTVARPTSTEKIIINELLFFVLNKSDTRSKTAVQSVVSNFYRDDEVITAKQLLIQNVDTSLHTSIQPYIRKRIGGNKT